MADEQDTGVDPSLHGPNPELYEKLAKPYPSKQEADVALSGFLRAVKAAREEFGVPEVLILAAAHFEPSPDSKETTSVQALAFGHPDVRAHLGAAAFNTYTLPELERAERLREMATMPVKKGKKR